MRIRPDITTEVLLYNENFLSTCTYAKARIVKKQQSQDERMIRRTVRLSLLFRKDRLKKEGKSAKGHAIVP